MNRKQLRALTDRVLGREVGCGDGACVFGHDGGMHTNGGCQCVKQDRTTASRLYMLLMADDVVDTSEPTIKPVGRLCLECGQTGDHFYSCSHHMAPDDETSRVDVYTHDDLVAVARWTLDYFSAVSKEDVQDEANDVVERLTGVKR